MADLSAGEGERIERGQQRRRTTILAGLFVLGLTGGGYIGWWLAGNDFDLSAPWPPAAALGLACAYVAAIFGGSIALSRQMDELERQNNYKAGAFAGTVYMILYPVWFLLWKGGFVPEPVHWAVFAVFWLSLIGSYLHYRFR